MSERDLSIVAQLRNTVIGVGIALSVTILTTGIAFYFTTKEKMKHVEKSLEGKADKELVQYQYNTILRELKQMQD